ncbi:MAG: NAD(+)/NADH kinase [Candidatus Aenigmarchaeota archaeon]|nr:NAD(+)/NADH kinase [Candidatus Aenigmarchaeota archaeon]
MAATIFSNKKHKSIKPAIVKLLKSVKLDAIVAVGGDGTFLRAFREGARTNKPVLCIRSGNSKGVLAEGGASEFEKMAQKIKAGGFSIIKYPMLEGRTEKQRLSGFNEIGFFRRTEEALRFDLFVNNVLFYENVVADGGIIATPAGSTAYNISSGGPVLDLASQSLVFTPLNPHGLNKPVVFEGSAKIVFKRHGAQAFADGKKLPAVKRYLEIFKSGKSAKVISLKTPFYTKWRRIVGI